MKEFIELTENLAKLISDIEAKRKKVGEILRMISTIAVDEDILEEKIILKVQPAKAELELAGVDGGLVKKSFHGIDLMLLRAVGVIFSYKDGKLDKVEYYPNSIPTPEPRVVVDPFSELEFEVNSNIERQIKEVTIAKETIEKYEPEILLMHGSVIPHYTFVPDKSSLIFASYRNMIKAYQQLFDTVKKRKTILAGVIEDSRGTRFCEIVSEKILPKQKKSLSAAVKLTLLRTKDSNLLTYALQKGERTFVFPYSSKQKKHPILREFPSDQIYSFYLKPVEFDRPIRIDFLGDKGVSVADRLSSILVGLSGHEGYAVPSVLVEADQRAKLTEKDLELFYFDLVNRVGNLPGLYTKRREQRPF